MPARYDAASLLAVAVDVFDERGYDGTSMEDLARATGIAKSSIYHHVPSKEALLAAAVDRALGALFAVLEEPAARSGQAIDALEHVVRRTTEVLFAELPFVRLLLRVHGNTHTEQRALQRRREFDRRVADLVRRATADGDLRADVDPRLATRLLFGMVNSVSEWRDPSRLSVRAVTDAVVAIGFDGLRRRD